MPTNASGPWFSGIDGRARQELVQDPRSSRGAADVRRGTYRETCRLSCAISPTIGRVRGVDISHAPRPVNLDDGSVRFVQVNRR
jgi:hypothetical protein